MALGGVSPPSWRDCAVRPCPDPVVWSVRLSPAGSIARRIRPMRSLCSPCRTVAPCDSNPVARSPTPAARRFDLRSPSCAPSLPCFPSALRSPAMQRLPPSPAALAPSVLTVSSWPMRGAGDGSRSWVGASSFGAARAPDPRLIRATHFRGGFDLPAFARFPPRAPAFCPREAGGSPAGTHHADAGWLAGWRGVGCALVPA